MFNEKMLGGQKIASDNKVQSVFLSVARISTSIVLWIWHS